MLGSLTWQVLQKQHNASTTAFSVCISVCVSDRVFVCAGQLSEQQKLELENHKALVVDQKIQLSMLTQKLTMMSQLVEKKDEETKKLGEKLRYDQKNDTYNGLKLIFAL